MSTTQVIVPWQRQPKAEALILELIKITLQKSPFIAHLEKELEQKTSTRLFDWIDHLSIPYTPETEQKFNQTGYVKETSHHSYDVLHHPGAQLPRVVLHKEPQHEIEIALAVEHIADFLMVRGLEKEIQGSILSHYRRCKVSSENKITLSVVERRCSNTMEPTYFDSHYVESYLKAAEMWMTRPRMCETEHQEDKELAQAIIIAEKITHLVGVDLSAWIILECERKYWQAKNKAGQLQKNRQDRLGMGWANHDHHTFRSSRRHFSQLIKLFETIGFRCRERFYAGEEAGWGAQVMEHRNTRLVLFLDLDLEPHEVEIDFHTAKLSPLKKLSTVGLWCALHGDSILKAGMHHLEAQFLFDELTEDLAKQGIGMMSPFSDFPFLRQAFTKGEMWLVDPKRIDKLLKTQLITKEQAERFSTQGAIGSHLENLQRREGYKGFNQKNVSYIIKETDPRHT